MELFDKLGRLAKLGGILGIALGSLALTVCGGRTGDPQNDAATNPDAAPLDAGVDATSADASLDGSSEQLDAQLWDVICE